MQHLNQAPEVTPSQWGPDRGAVSRKADAAVSALVSNMALVVTAPAGRHAAQEEVRVAERSAEEAKLVAAQAREEAIAAKKEAKEAAQRLRDIVKQLPKVTHRAAAPVPCLRPLPQNAAPSHYLSSMLLEPSLPAPLQRHRLLTPALPERRPSPSQIRMDVQALSAKADTLRSQLDALAQDVAAAAGDGPRMRELESEVAKHDKKIAKIEGECAGLREAVEAVKQELDEAGGASFRRQKDLVERLREDLESTRKRAIKCDVQAQVRGENGEGRRGRAREC